ncbi:hypothetical protein [Halopseudomonas sp.]|jgi:hypothetical protein|uniref:hypothetical protein n=1 Tax=Halopseudomonas sp. TaxID=2901191 RepID=UPI0039E30B60
MPEDLIDWHYPRTELAEQVLDRFSIGAATSLILFAPPHMGKTEFLLSDFLPMAASQRGFATAYVNFRDQKNDPYDSLLFGLREACLQVGRTDESKNVVCASLYGDVAISHKGATHNAQKLEAIQEVFEFLVSDDRRVVLVLEEIQQLNTDKSFEPLVFALRGMIDANRQRLRVIYTGSNRTGLQRLFNNRRAPLFSSARMIEIPDLGLEYLKHMGSAFNAATGRALNIHECISVFKALGRVPLHYRKTIEKLALKGGRDIHLASQEYLAENSKDEAHYATWMQLKPIDRAVAQWVASGNTQGAYGQEARRFVSERLGTNDIKVHSIQNAVNRMLKIGVLASVAQGKYVIENPLFRDWAENETTRISND